VLVDINQDNKNILFTIEMLM